MVPADYVHRIGRTGRAGSTGTAVSLVSADEAPLLREVERLLGHPIEQASVSGFEPSRAVHAGPTRNRAGDQRGAPPRRSPQAAASRADRDPGERRRRRPRRGRGAGSSIGNRWQPLPNERFSR